MRIDCDVDAAKLILRLRNGQRRFGYAVVNAINSTAKRIQAKERQHVEEAFTLRKEEFMKRQAAVIKPFASAKKAVPYAEVSVGRKPKLLLSAFERGGKREPVTPGAKRIAVPVVGGPARPEFSKPVTPELRMSKLRFDKTKTGKRRAGVRRAAVYLVPSVGIFKRTGPETTEMVYHFQEEQKLQARLQFIAIARRVAAKWFKEEMERETVKAITRSRGEGL